MADAGRAVGRDRAPVTSAARASAGMPQSEGTRSRRLRGNSVRATHGLPMERAERDGYLYELFGASTLPGVDTGGRIREGVGARFATLQRLCRYRLALAVDGRCAFEGATGWEKKPGPIPPIAPRGEPNEAY